MLHSLLFGRGRALFFAVWAGSCFFLRFGREAYLFFCHLDGTGVHSLTGLPSWALGGLTTKKQTAKKHGFRVARENGAKRMRETYISA